MARSLLERALKKISPGAAHEKRGRYEQAPDRGHTEPDTVQQKRYDVANKVSEIQAATLNYVRRI